MSWLKGCASRRLALGVALIAVVAAGALTAFAANPNQSTTRFYANCYYYGYSFENDLPGGGYIANSQTNRSSGTCTVWQFHVHAYFLGSEGQYHYYERNAYNQIGTQVFFCQGWDTGVDPCWWAGETYGYGAYKFGYSTTIETHAY